MMALLDALNTKSEVACGDISSAARRAIVASEHNDVGWDDLLNSMALLAKDGRCGIDPTPWFELISNKSQDPALRAHAEFHLGTLAQGNHEYTESVAHFDKCLETITTSPDPRSLARIEASALNWKSNSLSLMGKGQEAAATGRDALNRSVAASGENSTSTGTIRANQIHLEEKTGNFSAAIAIADDRLATRPANKDEARDYAHAAMIRYQLGIKSHEPLDAASAGLELAWADPLVHQSFDAVRVGHELMQARKRQKDRVQEGFDLAAELIGFIKANRQRWVAEASSPAVAESTARQLRQFELSCASSLQSIHAHRSLEYLRLAYETILEDVASEDERVKIRAQWDRAIARFAEER